MPDHSILCQHCGRRYGAHYWSVDGGTCTNGGQRFLAFEDQRTEAKASPLAGIYAAKAARNPTAVMGVVAKAAESVKVAQPLYYDGLTAAECLEAYAANMRREGKAYIMTALQTSVARNEWRLALATKVKTSEDEAKAKERNQVRVDLDFEEYE